MLKPTRRRLLTIGHSYVVGLNRRLADELARTGDWDVTAVAPARFRGDFGWHQAEAAPGEQCSLVPVPVHFSSRIHVMLYGRQLSRLLREQPWDLVHCWEEPYIAAAAQIVRAVPASVPLVFATFQNINKAYPPPFNWIERYAMGRADAMIAFGQTIGDVLARRGFPAEKTRLIPPGVDADRFAPDDSARAAVRAGLGWDDAVPVVGFVGRFVPEKGLSLMMRALGGTDAPWRALFVGSGPLEPAIREWAAAFPGRVAIQAVGHDEVPRWLNAMDILCAPSQTTGAWREQFGRMLIEAFACGVPVVASASGEIPHVVGDAGVIVPEGDAVQWVRVLSDLLRDPVRRGDLSRRGRRRALATYAWPVVARQHSAFFGEVIERRTARCA